MTLSPALRIMAVALVCVLGLIAIVVMEGNARAAGREITMETAPVDPRSLLSGHYVLLNLQTTIEGRCESFDSNDGAWLALSARAPETRIPPGPGTSAGIAPYAPRGRATSREAAQALGQIAVRGSAICNPLPDNGGKPQNGAIVTTTFENVSRFYIEQGEAERIGRMLNGQEGPRRVLAILSIGADGRARLKGLQVDDQRLELSWL